MVYLTPTLASNIDVKLFLKTVTHRPGIYQFFDAEQQILYVGKAKNLKKRLSSYFVIQHANEKTRRLVSKIAEIRLIVTASENEALLLECNLIKKFRPPYNILLRDDKSYPYIMITTQDTYPRMDIYRGRSRKVGELYGPYPSANAVRFSLNFLQKLFKIRQCTNSYFNNRARPCLQYQIKRCSAPCVGNIDIESYQQDLRLAQLFLQGKNQQVISELMQKMEQAASSLHFEQAAQYRDQIQNLRQLQEQQGIEKGYSNTDIIAYCHQQSKIAITIILVRNGQVVGNKNFFPSLPNDATETETLESFLAQYYLTLISPHELPHEIVIPHPVENIDWLEAALYEIAKRKITINTNVRGNKTRLLEMAQRSAEQALIAKIGKLQHYLDRFADLQKTLTLPHMPTRIACFDISHTQGVATMASCVVFNQQGADKNNYRRMNIKNVTQGDDYAAIHQAVYRYIKNVKEMPEVCPDVLLIDGGKGQLAAAIAALKELEMDLLPVLAIAKGPERKSGQEDIWYNHSAMLLDMQPHPAAFLLLQEIRDEAHRFAITGHRKQRSIISKASMLETIPGVGGTRRKHLLQRFGGLQGIKNASVDELTKVAGISLSLAKKIYTVFHDQDT